MCLDLARNQTHAVIDKLVLNLATVLFSRRYTDRTHY